MVISEYCLLIFKACRIGHPDFEIKFIDLFASNVIKTANIGQKCILIIIYTLLRSISHKYCMLTYSILSSHVKVLHCNFFVQININYKLYAFIQSTQLDRRLGHIFFL